MSSKPFKKDQIENVDISQVNNLQTSLDAKQNILSEWAFVNWDKTKLDWIETGAEVNTINDVIAWTNITIDKTDPLNPIISSTGGWWGGSVTTLDTLEITGTQYTGVVSSYRVGQSWTLAKFSAYLETAPTGSSFTVDLKVNGTTQATATITSGSNIGTTTSFTSSTLTEWDLVTYEITAIGSTVAGSNLTLILNLA